MICSTRVSYTRKLNFLFIYQEYLYLKLKLQRYKMILKTDKGATLQSVKRQRLGWHFMNGIYLSYSIIITLFILPGLAHLDILRKNHRETSLINLASLVPTCLSKDYSDEFC